MRGICVLPVRHEKNQIFIFDSKRHSLRSAFGVGGAGKIIGISFPELNLIVAEQKIYKFVPTFQADRKMNRPTFSHFQ